MDMTVVLTLLDIINDLKVVLKMLLSDVKAMDDIADAQKVTYYFEAS